MVLLWNVQLPVVAVEKLPEMCYFANPLNAANHWTDDAMTADLDLKLYLVEI
jgi:hypothetical protein